MQPQNFGVNLGPGYTESFNVGSNVLDAYKQDLATRGVNFGTDTGAFANDFYNYAVKNNVNLPNAGGVNSIGRFNDGQIQFALSNYGQPLLDYINGNNSASQFNNPTPTTTPVISPNPSSSTISNTNPVASLPITTPTPNSGANSPSQPQAKPSPAPTAVLQPGATGASVSALQSYLVSLGLMTPAQVATGPGIYGPQTTAAVAALQKMYGVDNSSGVGYYGPKTIAALQNATGGNTQTQNPSVLGASTTNTNSSNNTGSTTGTTSTTTPSSNPLTSILSSAGITLPATASLTDIVTQLSQAYGLNDVTTRLQSLDDKLASDTANINDDPWISEGIRDIKIKNLTDAYTTEQSNLLKELSTENTVVGQAITLYNAQQSNSEKILSDALTAANQQNNATTTTDTKNYNAAVSQGYKGSFEQFLKDQANLKNPTSANGSPGKIVSGTLTYTDADRASDSQKLEASRGSDGYVDPTIYQQLYTAWINAGGTLSGFQSTYPPAKYVNPANTWLPSYLMPPKSTSSSTNLF